MNPTSHARARARVRTNRLLGLLHAAATRVLISVSILALAGFSVTGVFHAGAVLAAPGA